jgi:hypothetical protein
VEATVPNTGVKGSVTKAAGGPLSGYNVEV